MRDVSAVVKYLSQPGTHVDPRTRRLGFDELLRCLVEDISEQVSPVGNRNSLPCCLLAYVLRATLYTA